MPKIKNNVNKLSQNADQFFAKILFNEKHTFFQIDSGSPISLLPSKLLNEFQKSKIINSNVAIESYGAGKVNNLGIIYIDLHMESLNNEPVILSNKPFFVTSSSMTPILGADILFAGGKQYHSIDKLNEKAIVGGKEIRIYESVNIKAKIVGDIKIAKKSKFSVFSSLDTVIGPNTESIIPAYSKTAPDNDLFIIESQNTKKYAIGGGLYRTTQFYNFPVRIFNPSEEKVIIKKDSKICPAFSQPKMESNNTKSVMSLA